MDRSLEKLPTGIDNLNERLSTLGEQRLSSIAVHLMDKRRIQQFKTRLEIRQQELRVTIEHQLKNARILEPEPDAVDQANSGLEKESLLQRGNQEKQSLRMIESALGRIREGTFGQCVSCRNEIESKRLEAVPWTSYCLSCQEDFER